MRRSWLFRTFGWTAVAAALFACAPDGDTANGGSAARPSLGLSFEDALAPEAFSREGPAVADASGGAAGYWAVVPGLRRPERALAVNLATEAQVTVALYAGRGGPGGAVRLSAAAAESLGIGATPTRVRVTAVRRVPRLAPP